MGTSAIRIPASCSWMMICVSKLKPSEFWCERDLLQGLDRVGPVARVELGEVGAERGVLEPGEDPVARRTCRAASRPGGPLP